MRVEPEGATLLDAYPSCKVIFKVGGWYDYCRGLSGHHPAVSKAFAKCFDEEKVRFKTIVLRVTKDSIAKATGLPTHSEKWVKRTNLKPSDLNHLSWDPFEGHFSLIFRYHLRLLSHLMKDDKLSLPFYFLKSLTKMASKYKGPREIANTYLFHQGLIKVLIMHELQRVGRSWDQFLCLEGFESLTNELEPLVMPCHAPSTHKGKEKVRNRALRSSASHESKDEGWDAPLEPICNFFSKPSLP